MLCSPFTVANAACANGLQFCGGGRVKSLRWRLPPGIYPPGPPPPDILGPPPDPKWSVILPPLPPWPEITVGHDNQLTYSEEPPCETESAELCSTTVTHSETLVGTTTSTATETSSYCGTVYGCAATGSETATTTTATACPLAAMATTAADDGTFVPPPPGCPAPAIVYPKDPENVGNIPSLLQGYSDYVEVGQTTENWVAFYWIPKLGQDTMNALRQSPDVAHAYYYEESNYNIGAPFTLEDEEEDEESLYWDIPSYPKAPLTPSNLDDRVSDKLPNVRAAARQETGTEPCVSRHAVLECFTGFAAQGQYLGRAGQQEL
ncbi:hypothetical protein ASPVEDRAFT_838932 [Aspergillus versicolor CBS 583.65]|uniref:Uncharacterized protein n=1 Tax=Aspergillus versicolor CBS 583.65 TaxID=1036611 RepID=A0A1L9PUR6_ASPVE|nr:uncharacterized protein ASPVEDRAFT_838932 [Aspergillus versicolor CBS 583.65]OJJ05261.1 hypothetical protein ASPVEDRAFT_838932 [Aspergillus versicolor CBS 583.65]